MPTAETLRDTIAADAGLAALLVGGIYTFAQTGRNGISRISTPEAFDGFLQPCAVIKAGAVDPVAPIRDSAAAIRQIVEVSLYDDGDSGYDAINAARDGVIALLDRRWIDDAGFVRHVGGADDGRDPKLNGAAVVRIDFEVIR